MQRNLIPFAGLASKGITYSRRQIERRVAANPPTFPKPLKIGEGKGGRIAWLETDLDKFIADRAAARETKGACA